MKSTRLLPVYRELARVSIHVTASICSSGTRKKAAVKMAKREEVYIATSTISCVVQASESEERSLRSAMVQMTASTSVMRRTCSM